MSKIAILEIEFYDDPADVNAPGLVWVTLYPLKKYQLCGPVRIVEFWRLFAGKVLYNLGDSPTSRMLRSEIQNIFSVPLTKASNVLIGENYALRFSERQEVPEKYIKASFHARVEKTGLIRYAVKTRFSQGGEDYYAPMGVFAFLQFIISYLEPEQLLEFYNLFVGED